MEAQQQEAAPILKVAWTKFGHWTPYQENAQGRTKT
jgi:hypothetical protein